MRKEGGPLLSQSVGSLEIDKPIPLYTQGPYKGPKTSGN